MPISRFDGNTFVAFLDISGFKNLMRKNKALEAINLFYSSGYGSIRRSLSTVAGIFVSDSGILFSSRDYRDIKSLEILLKVIKEINLKMLKKDIMITTSIAFGPFRYEERRVFDGIVKAPIYGNGYLNAFLDHDYGKPKIQPGQVRIIKKNLPEDVVTLFDNINNQSNIFNFVKKKSGDNQHYFYYWNLDDPSKIKTFEKEYSDTYNLKFGGMLRVLKYKI